MPPPRNTPLGARLRRNSNEESSEPAAEADLDNLNSRRQQHRASEVEVARLRELLAQFEGTHNFHNYTVGREFRDRAAQRYMIKLEVCPSSLNKGTSTE